MLAAYLLFVAAGPSNLVLNGSFDSDSNGWFPQSAGNITAEYRRSEGRMGGALYLSSQSDDPQKFPIWRYPLPSFPKGKALKLTAWVKGNNVQGFAGACMQGWNKGMDNIVDFATTAAKFPLRGTFDWTKIEATINPSSDTSAVHLLLMMPGKGEAWYDDISITADGDAKKDYGIAGSPGIFELKGETTFKALKDAPSSKILFPVPIDYREQIPLSYFMTAKPQSAVKSYRLYEDKPGNYVVEVQTAPIKTNEQLEIKWSSLVLAGPREAQIPASAAFPAEWPTEAKPWLKSTWCVQSDDPKFQVLGKALKSDSTDVMTVIKKAILKATDIMQNQKGQCTSLDAVQALEKQGSCTSNANLVAALLRSAGVPARILSGYPNWAGPLQTHYNVEAYVPGYGWYLIESTMLRPWEPFGQIQVAILPTEYEDKSMGRFPAAPGVPYLSLTEFIGEPSFAWEAKLEGKEGCDHVCHLVKDLDGDSEQWSAAMSTARKAWQKWLNETSGKERTQSPRTPGDSESLKLKSLADLSKG